MKIFIACILVICSLCLLLVSCGESSVVGTWTGVWDGSEIEITFDEDGVCGYKLDGFSYLGEWKTNEGRLTVTINEADGTRVFVDGASYGVEGDSLTVTINSKTVTLAKKQ